MSDCGTATPHPPSDPFSGTPTIHKEGNDVTRIHVHAHVLTVNSHYDGFFGIACSEGVVKGGGPLGNLMRSEGI